MSEWKPQGRHSQALTLLHEPSVTLFVLHLASTSPGRWYWEVQLQRRGERGPVRSGAAGSEEQAKRAAALAGGDYLRELAAHVAGALDVLGALR